MELTKFRNGNLAHVSHGAYSDRRVNPIARELVAALLEERPDLEAQAAAVWSWARIESKCLLLEAWTDAHGFLDDDGKPTAPANLIARFEKLAMSLRARIGLDPKSQAELQSARAQAALTTFDLEALKERGREAMLERSA